MISDACWLMSFLLMDESENIEILISAYTVAAQMILVAQEKTSSYRSRLFSFFLTIQSIPELPISMKVRKLHPIRGLLEFSERD